MKDQSKSFQLIIIIKIYNIVYFVDVIVLYSYYYFVLIFYFIFMQWW